MTKPTLKSVRLSALDQLTKTIINRLQAAGVDGLAIPDIAEGLLFARDTVRLRLVKLESEGRVYRVRHARQSRAIVADTWHLVGAPGHFEHGAMRQITVREYPVVGFRDWLQVAFHGPARKGDA